MNQYYSNDGGASWEGPLSEQELEMLRQAGVVTETSLLRSEAAGQKKAHKLRPKLKVKAPDFSEATAAARAASAPQLAVEPPPAPEQPDIYLMILGERKGPFTMAQVKEMLSTKQITKATLMWRTGMSEWSPAETLLGNGIIGSNLISNITGLGGFEGFSFKRFFGGIFQHHSSEELTDFFCSGSCKTTPSLSEISPMWPSPWIFARLILLSVVLYIGFTFTLDKYPNLNLVPGFMFVGNFAIPFCILILFAELNIQRNISFNRIVTAFLTGGFLSLLFTSLISDQIGSYEAYIAGPVEEPAKLFAALVIGRKFYDGRVLTGIVLGAAVGAGFAAFESAGYTFTYMLDAFVQFMRGNCDGSAIDEVMRGIMKLRAWQSPFAHVVWSAITGGAFWYVMGKKDLTQPQHTPLHMDCFADVRFLRIAWIPVVLHMLWNGLIPQFYALGYIFNIVLGAIAWLVVLLLVQQGIKQMKEAKKAQGMM